MSLCTRPTCDLSPLTDFTSVDVLVNCECAALPEVLVHFGVFPTVPSQPRMAISLNTLAAAINTHYTHRGFLMVNKKVRLSTFLL